MGNEFADGFLVGSDKGGNNGGFFSGEGLWAIIILAMLGFGGGWGGMGFGGGFGGGGAWLNGMATRADINEGFALNNITGGITAIQQGLCDSTYALNNTLVNGFHGVDRGLCDIGHQISDCCCTTQNSIQNVRFDMATGLCNLGNTIQSGLRDVMDRQDSGVRAILDFLTTDKIESLRNENQSLRFAASQAAQNAFISANQEAQTAELIRRLRTPEAVPAYVVPNPNCCYGNPVGIGYGAGYGAYGGGCGCGC